MRKYRYRTRPEFIHDCGSQLEVLCDQTDAEIKRVACLFKGRCLDASYEAEDKKLRRTWQKRVTARLGKVRSKNRNPMILVVNSRVATLDFTAFRLRLHRLFSLAGN
jgi:hypothetical protein